MTPTPPTKPTTTYVETGAQESAGPDVEATDALLAEIDDILEDAAVLRNYRQRGGQ